MFFCNTKRLVPTSDEIGSFAWSPDGDKIACGLPGGYTYIYNISLINDKMGGRPVDSESSPFDYALVAWSPNGKRVLRTLNNILYFVDADTQTEINECVLQNIIEYIALSPCGNMIYVSTHNSICVIDTNTLTPIGNAKVPFSLGVTFIGSNMGQFFYLRNYNNPFQPTSLYNATTLEYYKRINICWQPSPPSPDGKLLATRTKNTIVLWNIAPYYPKQICTAEHTDIITDLVWTPFGTYLMAIGLSGVFSFYKGLRLKKVYTYRSQNFSRFPACQWSSDGQYCAFMGFDKRSVYLYRAFNYMPSFFFMYHILSQNLPFLDLIMLLDV